MQNLGIWRQVGAEVKIMSLKVPYFKLPTPICLCLFTMKTFVVICCLVHTEHQPSLIVIYVDLHSHFRNVTFTATFHLKQWNIITFRILFYSILNSLNNECHCDVSNLYLTNEMMKINIFLIFTNNFWNNTVFFLCVLTIMLMIQN